MRLIRRWVYRMGFRPKYPGIFHSPTLHVLYAYSDHLRAYKKAIK